MDEQNGIHPKSSAARLRELLTEEGKAVICPGVYDGITAQISLNEGFDALYMTGAGTAMSRLGMPDLGLTTLNDMAANASMIASLDRTVPLIADADTGYGGPLMVARTVAAYMSAGVAAMHLEDQVVTKRCGHLANKELVEEDVYLSRIRAAVLEREKQRSTVGNDIVIIARTDALQQLGYDAAVSRLRRAIECGADVAFLEGMTSLEQCRRVCGDLKPTPVLLNMVDGGITPQLSAQEAQAAGFKIIIFPVIVMGTVFDEVTRSVKQFKKTGRNVTCDFVKTHGVAGMFNACGMQDCADFDKRAGGTSFNGGV